MSSKRVEGFRRTTQRLLAMERAYGDAKIIVRAQTYARRAEFATWLLSEIAADLGPDDAQAGHATELALSAANFHQQLLQRAVAGASRTGTPTTGNTSPRVTETPAATPVPPTVPSAVFSRGQRTEVRSQTAAPTSDLRSPTSSQK